MHSPKTHTGIETHQPQTLNQVKNTTVEHNPQTKLATPKQEPRLNQDPKTRQEVTSEITEQLGEQNTKKTREVPKTTESTSANKSQKKGEKPTTLPQFKPEQEI